ncbi:MAG: hypothetical protein JWO85_2645 [Candidatus Eremiobacteraeota bacterium]|nr:hypothetical protein [Candidatus Eremiobacteraeota bacterium]
MTSDSPAQTTKRAPLAIRPERVTEVLAGIQVILPPETPTGVWFVRDDEDGRYYGPITAGVARWVWSVVDPSPALSRRIHRLTVAEVQAISERAGAVRSTRARRTRTERKLASDVTRLLLALGEARAEVARLRGKIKPTTAAAKPDTNGSAFVDRRANTGGAAPTIVNARVSG